jgi:hypothetical protein
MRAELETARTERGRDVASAHRKAAALEAELAELRRELRRHRSDADRARSQARVAQAQAEQVVARAAQEVAAAQERAARADADLRAAQEELAAQRRADREADLGGAGMIGIDALKRQRLMLDFQQRLIKVEDAAKPPRSLPGEIVVTARLHRGQLILTEVKVGGLMLQAVVDTGSEVTIGNSALRDKLLRRHTKLDKVTAIGVTGTKMELLIGRIPELRLGSVTLTDVPIAFADVPPFEVFGLAGRPALLLGTDLLGNFRRVSLDFRARKVRFQLRRCTTQGIVISTNPDRMTRIQGVNGQEACLD